MTFNLRALSDSEASKMSNGIDFKEFSITPSTGKLMPQSEAKILVEFIPHYIQKYETALVVDVQDVGDDLFNLPIIARSTVPQIMMLSTNIDMGRCFIYHKYNATIRLSNETCLSARYAIIPSVNEEYFKFQSNQSEVNIEKKKLFDFIRKS
jgi:hypothetical protein